MRLRTVAVGDEMHTCEDWIWEFLNRRNSAGTDTKLGLTRRLTPAQRRRQQQRIDAELEAAGW